MVLGIASYLDGVLGLVNANIVDAHRPWEGEGFDIEVGYKVGGETQVCDDVLRVCWIRLEGARTGEREEKWERTIGSMLIGRAEISTRGSSIIAVE